MHATAKLAAKLDETETITLQARLNAIQEREGNPMQVHMNSFGKAKAFLVQNIPGPSYNTVRGLTDDDVGKLCDIVSFYHRYSISPCFEIIPVNGSRRLLHTLAQHGFFQTGFHTCMFKPISNDQQTTDVPVKRLRKQDFVTYGRLYTEAFSMPEAFAETVGENNRRLMNDRNWRFYYLNGGFGVLHLQNKTANLTGAGTIPKKRGTGIHTTMIHERLKESESAGCTLAIAQAAYGSQSMNNLLKAGFKIAYTRATWQKL